MSRPRLPQLLTILIALAGTSAAQEPPVPPPASAPPQTTSPDAKQETPPGASEDPRALFEKGSALYALGRYSEAAPLFERAFTLKPDPALLYNAAQAYRLMGNQKRALTLYRNYLHLYGDKISNPDEVKRQIAQLEQAIAARERAKTVAPPSVPPSSATTLVATVPPRKPPLVKRPWFWIVVGGGAAVVATGLAVGIALGTRGHVDPAPTFGTVRGN